MILHLIVKISSKLDDTSITNNQPIDYLDASLTDFLPTPHRPRSNHAIEKKLDVMNKRLMKGFLLDLRLWSKKMIGQVIRHVFNRILSQKHDWANN
jgi:hypothetical protein